MVHRSPRCRQPNCSNICRETRHTPFHQIEHASQLEEHSACPGISQVKTNRRKSEVLRGSFLPHGPSETSFLPHEFGLRHMTEEPANGDGEQSMGANKSRRQSREGKPSAPNLPRHVIEHIGQVLRNRYREDLLVPIPREMLTVLETTSRSNSRMSSDWTE
jgi:hypothetical protein